MSVQSAYAERRQRLGFPVRPRTNVVIRYSAPVAEIPSPPPAAYAPSIPLAQFEWAHKLADEFGGDASALVGRGEWRRIIDSACAVFQVQVIDVISERRTAAVIWPRQVCMWLLRRYTILSLPAIGKRLGGKDHTTCLYGCRIVQQVVDGRNIDVGSTWQSALDALARFETRPKVRA